MTDPYVGYVGHGKYVVFLSDTVPTQQTHGKHVMFAIGPFRTMAAAHLCASTKHSPSLVCVDDFEAEIARRIERLDEQPSFPFAREVTINASPQYPSTA